ncbi:SdpI family protein [Anaerotignum sp.]
MKIKKISMLILSVLPLLMVLAVYSRLPEQVPMHWGIDGTVDRYGAKWELFFLAGLNILLGILMPFLAKIDPKHKNYKRFQKTYDWMILWLLGFLAGIMGLTLAEAMQPGRYDMCKWVCAMVAVLFISLGNMLPKVKQNYFTGVRTPWALQSDTVWNKSQRLGGKIFVFGGILMLISALCFAPRVSVVLTITVAIGICLIPTVMSYVWYRQEMGKKEE